MKQELKDHNSPIWWAIWAAIMLVGVYLLFQAHDRVSDQLTFGNVLQVATTFALPFIVYLLVEKRKSEEQKLAEYFIRELDNLKEVCDKHRSVILYRPVFPDEDKWYHFYMKHFDFLYNAESVFRQLAHIAKESSITPAISASIHEAHNLVGDVFKRRWVAFVEDEVMSDKITNEVWYMKNKEEWETITFEYKSNLNSHLFDIKMCCHYIQLLLLKGTDKDVPLLIKEQVSIVPELPQITKMRESKQGQRS